MKPTIFYVKIDENGLVNDAGKGIRIIYEENGISTHKDVEPSQWDFFRKTLSALGVCQFIWK